MGDSQKDENPIVQLVIASVARQSMALDAWIATSLRASR
jgi:hypothetical protein